MTVAYPFQTLVNAFASAAASGDGDALADLFTDDGIYVDYFFGPYQGRAAIKEMLSHFAAGGRDFRWTFAEPVSDGRLGYARYQFSYTSTAPEAGGARVRFDGMGQFTLAADGRIRRYVEVFDRGMALAQQNFAGERIAKVGRRYAEALARDPQWQSHG
jgi:uncharacterized protein (TIGR02246 family)